MLATKFLCALAFSSSLVSCAQTSEKRAETDIKKDGMEATQQDNCNWCGTSEVPDNVSWRTTIPPEGEPGEKLIISGTVYLPDGKTPAKDIIIYVHHTNIVGIYPKNGNEKGNGKYHGYLRGWMKTDSTGKYEFETIRPAPYKTHGGEPAHIHYSIEGPDYPEYWLTALWFDDDPRVNEENLKNVKRSGGFSNVTAISQDKNGNLRGTRNIILERFEK